MLRKLLALLLLAIPAALLAEDPKLTEPKFLLTWGQKGDKPGEFHSPIGIAINARDEIFVTDLNNARVQKFDANGKHLAAFDLPLDTPPRKSNQSGGIAIDADGLIYLSNMAQHKIAVYSEDGKLIREWGKNGAGDGELSQPGGIVFAKDGTLLVADQGNHRIVKFTPEGKFLARWGEHGTLPGQFGGAEPKGSRFAGPHFISLDSRGRMYTTEGTPGRVQQLSADGAPLGSWGSTGDEPGGFGALKTGFSKITFGPIAVMVDRHDRVWVSSLNNRVQAFTPEGKYLFGIAASGKEPGQLARPHGMAMDSRGHLYVCDAGNQRVQKFAVPGLE